MDIPWIDIIDRARMYLDDDHKEKNGWIKDDKWLILAQVEYEQLYSRWLRGGVIGAEPVDREFTGPRVDIEGVLAVVGVAEVVGDYTLEDTYFKFSTVIAGAAGVMRQKTVGSADTVPGVATGTRPSISFVADGVAPGGSIELDASAPTMVYHFQPGITTWADFNSALASSGYVYLEAVPAGVIPTTAAFAATAYAGGTVIGQFRPIPSAQESGGPKPFSNYRDAVASRWEGHGAADDLTIRVTPNDSTGTYVVRYLECPVRTTDSDDTVALPFARDERLVLGTAKRAALKESGASALLRELIREADEEANFAAQGRNGGIRFAPPRSTPRNTFSPQPADWVFYR